MPFASCRRQHLHLDERVVHAMAPDGQKLMLRYDSLVVAALGTDAYFGLDEWVVFAPGLKTLAADGDRVGHIAAVRQLVALGNETVTSSKHRRRGFPLRRRP